MLKCILFLLAGTATAQNVITTFAGAPKVFSPGSPALSTSIAPSGLAVGPKGEVYFGDSEANVVLRLAADGTLAVVAGNGIAGYSGDGGPAIQASLNQPSSLAVDKQGNLYINDSRNLRLRKVDLDGVITTLAGNGQTGFSGDGGPAIAAQFRDVLDLAVDAAGSLYIADFNNARVRRLSAGGIITTVAGNGSSSATGDGGQATQAGIGAPSALAFDGAGNLYISTTFDGFSNSVRKVSPAGIISTFFTADRFEVGPTSLTVDPDGNVYGIVFGVANMSNDAILKFSGTSAPTVVARSIGDLLSIRFDTQGTLYFSESTSDSIQKIDKSGNITTVAGTGFPNFFGDGGPARSAGLSSPISLVIDQTDTAYIADLNNGRIRMVDPKGKISTFATFKSYTFAGLALAPGGGLFLGGGQPHLEGVGLINRISADGSSVLVAGGGSQPSADGTSAAKASLTINDLTADAAGNLYFVDLSSTVRKIDQNGTLSTPAGGVKVACILLVVHQCLTTDRAGNVYAPAATTTGILKITPTGAASTIPVPAASAIAGIAVDSTGNVFISDSGSHQQILKVSSDGTAIPFAGNNTYGYGGDGGPALQAAFFGPVGLALDSANNLYIADSLNGRIRKVTASSTSIGYTVSPATLPALQATSGGSLPAVQNLTLTPDIAGLTFTATSDAPWLSVIPSSGAMPATLQLSADPSQLPPGPYRGTVTITAPNATTPVSTFVLNFNVSPAVIGKLSVSSPSVSFSLTKGAASATSSLTLSNQGSGTLNFSITAATQTGGDWLRVSPTGGTVSAGQPLSISITANPANLDAGTYTGVITLASVGQPIAVPVTLAISAPPQKILLSQSGLSFTAVAQGGTPLPQTFGILNTGQGSLNWTADTSTFSGGYNWLNASPSSGAVQRPYLDVSLVTVTIDPGRLTQGTYYGQIQVKSAGAANSPQIITVVLSVLSPGSNPGPEVRPTGLIFTGTAGSTPGSQDVLVGNPSSQSVEYVSGQIGKGFSFLPADATVDPTRPTTVHIYPDFSSLALGTIQRGTVTLQFTPDGTPRTISVLNVVAPSGSGAVSQPEAGDSRSATGCPSVLYPQFTQLGTGAALQTGFPGIVAVKVVDDCGNPMTTGSVVATFSDGTPPLSLTNLQDGNWETDWEPRGGSSNGVLVTVTAQVPGLPLPSSISQTVGVTGDSTLPSLANRPVSAVTLEQVPLAPGDLILLKGTGLASGKATAPSGGALQLGGSSLIINGSTSSLLYADSGTVVGLIPPDVPVNTSVGVVFLRDSVPGIPSNIVISSTHPSILTKDSSGAGQGLIYKAGPTLTLADSNAPLKAGDSIVIYSAGLGLPDQKGSTQNPPSVTIGGQAAQVTYAGGAISSNYPLEGAPTILGGLVSAALGGLYQINAIVPPGVSSGNAAVVISSAGQSSRSGVTMAISGTASSATTITSINTAYGPSDIAQNDFIEIHGNNLASSTAGPSALKAQLGGVSVTVNGKPALLYYVSPNQINALTPLDDTLGPVSVIVINNGVPGAPFSANLRSTTPAFLRFDSGHVTATHADGSYLGPASLGPGFTPANPGETIVIYAVGFGLPSTPLSSGLPSQSGTLPALPACLISNTAAPVAFAGLNGFAGLYQLNLIVPSSAVDGDNSISCTYSGQTTPAGALLTVQH